MTPIKLDTTRHEFFEVMFVERIRFDTEVLVSKRNDFETTTGTELVESEQGIPNKYGNELISFRVDDDGD